MHAKPVRNITRVMKQREHRKQRRKADSTQRKGRFCELLGEHTQRPFIEPKAQDGKHVTQSVIPELQV